MIKKAAVLSPWIQYWRPKADARLRLFCFPYAGGGASVFRSWSALLPPQIEIWPVQFPGRENRLTEEPFTHLSPLVATLVEALLPYLDSPYAFFGHSMGALVSFELTRALQRTGGAAGPLRLCVSGFRAPQLPFTLPAVHDLPEPAFVEELRRLKGTPEEVLQHAELLQLLLPLLRADFAVCETYQYIHQAPLACPISAFGGLEDKDIPCESIAAWRDQTCSSFQAHFFDGDHFFLEKERSSLLRVLADDLLADLSS